MISVSPARKVLASLVLLLLALAAIANAQERRTRRRLGSPEEPYRVAPATSKITIDGSLDEQAWVDAMSMTLDYEWFPGDGIEPPVATDVFITYDPGTLYVAFRCWDPEPKKIRAHLMDRDEVDTFVQDDHVLVMIDPFNDERRAFQFRVNPLGVQMDAIFSEIEGIEDFSWDIIWKSMGRITSDGYEVELAIPLSQIRFPSGSAPQTWGFDVGRSYPRNVRHRITSNYRDRNINCILCQADKVAGFADLKPGKNIELDPTLTASRSEAIESFPDGSLEKQSEDAELGLTGRWNITADLTLSAAINPDFSQVEADAVQLEANERFALRYPERRPFFLEGIDFFATPIEAVFTRTIADPLWGLKLTGKKGRNAFGVFIAEDENPPVILVPFNQLTGTFFVDDEVTTGVARYRRDIGGTSTLGVMYAGREGKNSGYYNRVGGIDGFLRLNNTNQLRFQYLYSDTLYPEESGAAFWNQPEGEAFTGHAVTVDWQYQSRNWVASLRYNDRDEGFRADSGFVPRVNFREAGGNVARIWWGEQDDWYSRIGAGAWAERNEMQDGTLSGERTGLFVNFFGPWQSYVELNAERLTVLNSLEEVGIDRSTLYEGLMTGIAYAQLQPTGDLKLSTLFIFGDGVDFQLDRAADELLVEARVEWKAGRRLNLQLNQFLNQLDDVATGVGLLEESLTELRAVYQFNLRTFVRAIVQRSDLSRRSAVDSAPFEGEDIFSQLLFSYKLNPQTVLFLGYEESRADSFFDFNSSPPQLLVSSSPVPVSRYFFFKIGYALLF
jgi:hypothetical protein